MVLKHFNVSVTIKCGKPFNVSVFHLLSYRPPTKEDDNFFEYSICDHSDCKLHKGPLAKAIERHSLKHSVINSCLDAEGFTPLHRAAQGANVVAIRYLLANGADDSILSPHGNDALSLAVLHAGRSRILWRLYGFSDSAEHLLEITQASNAAIELLRHAMKTRGYRIRCDPSKSELTLYHLAASRGLANFIDELLKEMKYHQLNVDCPNSDGITPMYLAKLFGQKVQDTIIYNPWEHVIDIIKSHGGKMRYPSKEAEYYLIHTRMYGFILVDFSLDFRPDIRHYVTSLLLLYEQRENSSFYCHADGPWNSLASSGDTLDTLYNSIWSEIHLWENQVLEMLKGKKRCFRELDKFYRYRLRLMLYRLAYTNILKTRNLESLKKALLNWLQQSVLNLMQMRHKEIFGAFACMKSLIRRFQPLLNGTKLKILIRRYEENPSLSLYLYQICSDFRRTFGGLLHHFGRQKLSASESSLVYPDFIDERIFKIATRKSLQMLRPSELFHLTVEWPLKLFFNLFFGDFRRYDYLKTLLVGIEQDT